MSRFLSLGLAALLTAGLTTASAARVPGTETYWSYSIDPITDVNKSNVVLYEVNDTSGDTGLIVKCSSFDEPGIWAFLQTKNTLVNAYATQSDGLPDVIMRLGSDPAVTLPVEALRTVVDADGEISPTAVAISGATVQRIINGLNAGKRVVIRVNRETGGQPLTYTFSAAGFTEAWRNIRACGQGRAAVAPPAPAPTPARATPQVTITTPRSAAPAGVAPKFTQWYFTGCVDASSGARRANLVAGYASLCTLAVDTIPNGARVTRADFRYELELREAGRVGTMTLDGMDTWPSSGGTKTSFFQSGNTLNFTLPLNVRWRTDRTYTSINVTATVYFDNGSSKRVFEKLPVSQY